METKEMKNIKVPSYAKNFGDGKFCAAQPTWQCIHCGKCAYTPDCPGNWSLGKCSGTAGGYHQWQRC